MHLEGIHLRSGPIARGGLRFSDRPSDFRTEVLELMSTQTVKNGQIVPTGAKGGFVVRDGSGSGFVLDQYRTFIDTLLALTDNLENAASVSPEGMRIAEHDLDDPYLVVAADKGTARYSDDANARALHADFWLGDAFASGGGYGYDHKKVGITARGAWVCAAHHFSKMGIDAYSDPISCVAIGDMGGDVFGNGMLLNPELNLIAAFNHRHIFLDPTPDAKRAFQERQRMFGEQTAAPAPPQVKVEAVQNDEEDGEAGDGAAEKSDALVQAEGVLHGKLRYAPYLAKPTRNLKAAPAPDPVFQ